MYFISLVPRIVKISKGKYSYILAKIKIGFKQ
nr:MAG TPA: hypothetical protein [Caudoviricetes sp.]